MNAERARITVRVTPQQRAIIGAAARRLGMTTNDFVAARALERAEQDAAIEKVAERMAEFESSLAGVLDAVREDLKRDFDEAVRSLNDSQTHNLKQLTEFLRAAVAEMKKRS